MQKTIQIGDRLIHFVMLGRVTGGYNSKYSDDEGLIQRNLKTLRTSFDSTSSTLTMPQCRSKIVTVEAGMEQAFGDALLTNDFNHALLLRPADCVPLLLYSDQQSLIALVHGSRQGLDEGIIKKCIDEFTARGAQPARMHGYIGPCIQRGSYLLPLSVRAHLTHPSWSGNTERVDGQLAVDIAGFTKEELLRLGLPARNISRSNVDTATSNRYYSHYQATRSQEPNGRNGVAVVQTKAV